MRRELVYLLTCLCLIIGQANAQNREITGIVVAGEDGEPVVGASVLVKGSTIGTVTNAKGRFILPNVSGEAETLQVSYIGMQTKEVEIKPNLRIVLQPDLQLIDEVMVIAYGTTKKSSFTGSAATVKSEKIEKIQASNLTKVLEGNVAGVQMTASTGQPGEASKIYVRGVGSILASQNPLIVVDGMPYEGSLNSINSQDVESITVLKDAAANSMYGARGANGVVLVTTRKGHEGKTDIRLEAKWGVNSRAVRPYRTIRSEGRYYELAWESLRNQQIYAFGKSEAYAGLYASENLINNLGNYNSYNVADNLLVNPETGLLNPDARLLYHDDWLKDPFENALRQEYNFSMSGGNDKTTYYASLNYLNDGSYLKSSDFSRFTGRLKLEHQATKWLRTGFNVGYAQTTTNTTAENALASNMFSFSQFIAPIFPIWARDEQGNIRKDESGNSLLDYGNLYGKSRPYAVGLSPYSTILHDIRETKLDIFNARLFGEATLMEGLKLAVNFSIDNFATYRTNFTTPLEGDAQNVGGRGTKESRRDYIINANQLLTYEKSIKKHAFNLLLGHESKADNNSYLMAKKEQFYLPTNPELDNAVSLRDANSYVMKYNIEGYFFRGEYNYADTYYLSGSYRTDGSSRFDPSNRWGHFWSLGGSWRLKQEPWLQDATFLHDLKLRASYGTQGNDNLGNSTPYLDQFDVVPVNGKPGLSQTFRGNRNITWEKSNNFNIGIDAGFWSRVNLSAEFFIKNTRDMLTSKNLATSEGSPSYIYTNDMAMKNVGVEVNLNALLIRTSQLNWIVDLNLTHYKNQLTRLEEGKDPTGYATEDFWRKKGGTLYDWYLIKYAGVDPDNGDALYYKDVKGTDGSVTIDTTNDPNKATRYETGKSALPDLYGGLSTTLETHGFDLSISTAFSVGGYVYDSSYQSLMTTSLGNNFSTDINKRWTPQNPYTDVPRVEVSNRSLATTSDRFLTRGDYFSLKNVTLGYTFPRMWMNKIGMETIRLFAVGDNLWLGSKRVGLDPRQKISGETDVAMYAAIRTISFGINVKF